MDRGSGYPLGGWAVAEGTHLSARGVATQTEAADAP